MKTQIDLTIWIALTIRIYLTIWTGLTNRIDFSITIDLTEQMDLTFRIAFINDINLRLRIDLKFQINLYTRLNISHSARPKILSRFSAESLFERQCRAVIDQLLYKFYNIIAAISSEQARESNPRLPPRGWNYLESNQGRRICNKTAPQGSRTPVCLTGRGSSDS